jgi:hypothetical protein
VSPLRLTKAPRNPLILQPGDSGGAALYHDGQKWGLAGLLLGSNLSIRHEEEPLTCYEYFLKILYSRKFLHKFLPERKDREQPIVQAEVEKFKSSTIMTDAEKTLKQAGISAYASELDKFDDSSYINRTVSRLKHKIKRALGLYHYPSLAVTIVTPYSYALKFAHTLKSMESLQSEGVSKPLILYPRPPIITS